MTGCVVKRCLNYSAKHGKSSGVTFHRHVKTILRLTDVKSLLRFPTDPVKRALWTEKIRLSRKDSRWNPTKNSRICSRHFEDKDKFTSKAGLCKLNKNAMPTKDLFVAYILVGEDELVSKNITKKESKRKLKNQPKKGNDMKLDNEVKFEIEVELNEVTSDNDILMETQVKLENEVELQHEVDLETEMRAEHEIRFETQVKLETVTDDETPHVREEEPISSHISPQETHQAKLKAESASTTPNCTKHEKIIRCLRRKIFKLTEINKSLKEKLKTLKIRNKE